MELTLFSTIVKLMNHVDKFVDMEGKDKKKYVFDELKKILTDESYERYFFFIDITIDGIIDISRKKIKLYLNKRKLYFPCISK